MRSSKPDFSDCDLAENNSFPIKIPIPKAIINAASTKRVCDMVCDFV